MTTLSLDRTPVPGNLAIRRSALAGIETPGHFEYEIVPRLLAAGLLAANDRQRVVHDQSLGLVGSWIVHFASGRAYGAVEETESLRALALAEELGCNFVDTAQVYGDAGRLGAAIVVAVLAVAADGGFGLLQRAVTPRALRLTNRRTETA